MSHCEVVHCEVAPVSAQPHSVQDVLITPSDGEVVPKPGQVGVEELSRLRVEESRKWTAGPAGAKLLLGYGGGTNSGGNGGVSANGIGPPQGGGFYLGGAGRTTTAAADGGTGAATVAVSGGLQMPAAAAPGGLQMPALQVPMLTNNVGRNWSLPATQPPWAAWNPHTGGVRYETGAQNVHAPAPPQQQQMLVPAQYDPSLVGPRQEDRRETDRSAGATMDPLQRQSASFSEGVALSSDQPNWEDHAGAPMHFYAEPTQQPFAKESSPDKSEYGPGAMSGAAFGRARAATGRLSVPRAARNNQRLTFRAGARDPTKAGTAPRGATAMTGNATTANAAGAGAPSQAAEIQGGPQQKFKYLKRADRISQTGVGQRCGGGRASVEGGRRRVSGLSQTQTNGTSAGRMSANRNSASAANRNSAAGSSTARGGTHQFKPPTRRST